MLLRVTWLSHDIVLHGLMLSVPTSGCGAAFRPVETQRLDKQRSVSPGLRKGESEHSMISVLEAPTRTA